MKRQTILSILLMVLLAGAFFSSPALAEEQGKQLPMAPDFSLKDMEGQRIALGDLLGRGPILIDFWATWCKPCLRELPHVQKLYDKYKEKGLFVIAISEDTPRSISKVKSFIATKKHDFLVLLDENNSVQRKFNFRAIPYTVLLDKEGHIVFSRLGYRPGDEQVLEEKLLPLIEAQDEQGRTSEEAEREPAEGEEAEAKKGDTEGERGERKYIKKVKSEEAKVTSSEECDE